jgi:transposase
MRGDDQQQSNVFSYVSLEDRVPADHPLRPIRKAVDQVLKTMSREFDQLYAEGGRASIAPERLLRALLLQVFYSIRSERMLVEQLEYNLLFRWFVGMEMDEEVWNHSTLSKNRDRLLNQDVARMFFTRVREQAREYMSDEHFTVDGTMIEEWASQKSFQKKDGDGGDGENFHGHKRRNDTHASPQRHACLQDRSGCQAVSQGSGAGGAAELSGARVDGKSQRVNRGRDGDRSGRQGRAGCSAADGA